MRPYSMDLRERVVQACDAREGTRKKIAERFGVCTAWIRRVLQRRRERGSLAPRPQNAGRKRAIRGRDLERLRRRVARRPDATPRELKAGLKISVSDGPMLRALATLGLTRAQSWFSCSESRTSFRADPRPWRILALRENRYKKSDNAVEHPLLLSPEPRGFRARESASE